MTTKGERREAQRSKARYGMRVDGAQVRRIQPALIERAAARRRAKQREMFI